MNADTAPLPDHGIPKILVKMFREVLQVKSICAEFRANEIAICTLLDSYDRNARAQIYKRELEISSQFRLRDFDFRVTAVDLVLPDDLVKAGSIEIYRRD